MHCRVMPIGTADRVRAALDFPGSIAEGDIRGALLELRGGVRLDLRTACFPGRWIGS
jgi:hypothetical protein